MSRPRAIARSIALFAVLLATLGLAGQYAHATTPRVPAPLGLPGQQITSPDGVAYTFYSGKAPSFDGLPLAVDVTIPANAHFPLPLVAFFHGWTQSRTAWESQTIANSNPNVNDWNNVSFAARGYAVLNYTIRGWHDSCGPDAAAVPDDPATLPTACTSHQYWVHLADPRWEIHDAQYLIGKLVDEGIADPRRIGVTGGSYGGGHTWLLALLNDRTVSLDGSLSRWTSPNGTPLHIAAAVPEYTWASLTNSLLPNGRESDTSHGPAAVLDSPVGVPIQSYTVGLYASGQPLGNAFYSAPGTDPTADLTTWNSRFAAGNPYADDPTTDPVTYRAIQQLDLRSPLFISPDANVPVFQIQGTTDPLFPPVQALMMRNAVLAWNPAYPIKSFFGDIGHSNAGNPPDVWEVANSAGNAFFDYYLLGKGTRPSFDVTTATTDCVLGQTRQIFTAPSWQTLSDSVLTFDSNTPQVTSSASAGLEGPATDPLTHSGCLSVPAADGSGVAAWAFPIATPTTLIGQPTIGVSFASTGTDVELNVRLWDVSPDGSTQTLVSRGTYRYLGTVGEAATVRFQISGNAWELLPGHTLRLEVVGNDSSYFQQDNIPSTTTLTEVTLALPVR